MKEMKHLLNTLIRLRKKYNLLEKDVNELLNFSKGKYSRIENGTQVPTFEDIVSISKVYGLEVHKILHPELVLPNIEELPTATKKKASTNRPGSVKKKTDSSEYDFNDEILLVLSTYDLERTFTNFEIIEQLPKELSKLRKNRPIEWNKGKLKGLVVKTGNRRIGEWVVDGMVLKSKGTQEEYRLVKVIKK